MTRIIMVTNKGEINLNLFDEDAPMTVASFLFLANQGYYKINFGLIGKTFPEYFDSMIFLKTL